MDSRGQLETHVNVQCKQYSSVPSLQWAEMSFLLCLIIITSDGHLSVCQCSLCECVRSYVNCAPFYPWTHVKFHFDKDNKLLVNEWSDNVCVLCVCVCIHHSPSMIRGEGTRKDEHELDMWTLFGFWSRKLSG